MTTSDQTAPPQLSPDGHWWWDGSEWVPAAGHVNAALVLEERTAADPTPNATQDQVPATVPVQPRMGTILGGPLANARPVMASQPATGPVDPAAPEADAPDEPSATAAAESPFAAPTAANPTLDFFGGAIRPQAPHPAPTAAWPAAAAPLPSAYPAPPSAPPAPAGRSWVCVAALVLGILPTSFAAVIVGVCGLLHASRTHKTGRNFALSAIVLGLAWTGVFVAVDALDGKKPARELTAGECLAPGAALSGRIFDVPTVSCSKPHEMEVFATFRGSGDQRPSTAELADQCELRVGDYLPAAQANPDLSLTVLFPEDLAWSRGDHGIVCLVDGPLRSGSLLDDGGRKS